MTLSNRRSFVRCRSHSDRDRVLEKEMKPHLVVTEKRGEIPVRGTCSACPGEIFAPPLMGDRSYNLALLQELFDEHLKKVHLREDAN
jgi:DNA helicase TIP49 (TBP-interacting protein)